MNIIKHIYIGILPIALHTTIKAYLTFITHRQNITNQYTYLPNKKSSNIIILYHNKAKHNCPVKYALNVLVIGDKPNLLQLYHQVWNIISIYLL